jgi:hypothetical protein
VGLGETHVEVVGSDGVAAAGGMVGASGFCAVTSSSGIILVRAIGAAADPATGYVRGRFFGAAVCPVPMRLCAFGVLLG